MHRSRTIRVCSGFTWNLGRLITVIHQVDWVNADFIEKEMQASCRKRSRAASAVA